MSEGHQLITSFVVIYDKCNDIKMNAFASSLIRLEDYLSFFAERIKNVTIQLFQEVEIAYVRFFHNKLRNDIRNGVS